MSLKDTIEQSKSGISDWIYYNHAIIPKTSPHLVPDISAVSDRSIWKSDWEGKPLLARWTTDFDCGYETEWWYCIKDNAFDITSLQSKKRYEINKGKKFFDVKTIDPNQYIDDIFRIQKAAFENYPAAYRPNLNYEDVKTSIMEWKHSNVFGAFDIEKGELHAYAVLNEFEDHVDFAILKAEPSCEKFGINAAIVAAICEYYSDRLCKSFYISDGERNIIHETAFHDYLIKYFGFRKAYCKLNVAYKKPFGIAVKLLLPFFGVFEKLKNKALFSKIYAVLKMERYSRNQL